MKYRPEIDGLRAIAVLPVMLYHAKVGAFSGGFIGVDVFFVISGYLITSLIIRDLADGRFSVLDFYERRARRILPSLFLVIAVSALLAFMTMLPYQLKEFATSVMWVNLFISNTYFRLQSGYFAGNNDELPLLHTWSLGIEEQFYLFFPLIMILIWRFGRKFIWPILALAALASLITAQWFSFAHPASNFFLLRTRVWELLAGALCAVYLINDRNMAKGIVEVFPLLGLSAIIASFFLFNETTRHPGFYTAIPVGGVVMIILFARKGTFTWKILANPMLVGIGLISYSAYLWHQPLLAFARIYWVEIFTGLKLGILGLSLLLAFASWKYVERPFRNRDFLTRSRVFALSFLAALALFQSASWVVSRNGFADSYPEFQRQFITKSPIEMGRYVNGRYNSQIRNTPFSGNDTPKLLLIGDSFSQDFFNEILAVGAFTEFEISASYIPAACQIYLGAQDISRFRGAKDKTLCAEQYIDQGTLKRAEIADIVIFAASWKGWAAERLPETLGNFNFRPDQRVYVLGTKGFGQISIPALIRLSPEALIDIRVHPRLEKMATNELMAAILPPEQFINVMDVLCDSTYACPQFTPQGALISHDGDHLTPEGVQYVSGLVFQNTLLREFVISEQD